LPAHFPLNASDAAPFTPFFHLNFEKSFFRICHINFTPFLSFESPRYQYLKYVIHIYKTLFYFH